MAINRKKVRKIIGAFVAVFGSAFVVTSIIAKKKKKNSIYNDEPEQKNPLEGKKVIFVKDENDKMNADGVKGHLVAVGNSDYVPRFYERYLKRGIDIVLSFGGLVVLAPVFVIISLAIIIEDPGPILFTQKRIGQNKKYFKLHKFRSMKMNTPHDVPTHMLENPDQYITKVGKFIRAHSLDELPQIWDIFIGNMSVIGPRPGLWNQDVLTAERDKYGANSVKPGLTGLAQINGRDELEIPDKAKLDGIYAKNISFFMDLKVFIGSIHVFGKDESVVEGGTGEIAKVSRHYTDNKTDAELIGNIGFGQPVSVNTAIEKKILITGAGSYIGEAFQKYATENYPMLKISTVDMIDGGWKKIDFSSYDIVYHVAGLAHADVGKVDEETKAKYYAVNTDLAIEVCEKAKVEGVKEFIFMSSMIVYGDSAPYGKKKVVDVNTVPKAANFYGDSKLQADIAVRELADDDFKVFVLRPPMIYGKGSRGNYPILAKLAKKLPIFPDIDNERSMLHIDNLCEFLCQIMLIQKVKQNATVLIPQNAEWTKTSNMVKIIAQTSGKKIKLMKTIGLAVSLAGMLPGKIGGLIHKAFGNSVYAHEISVYEGINYQNVSLNESIIRTEKDREPSDKEDHIEKQVKNILVVTQYFYPENFRINDMCLEWVKRGYKVTVVTGIPNYPMGKVFEGYGLTKKRHEIWNEIEIIRIPLIPRGSGSIGMVANYVSFAISGIIAGLTKKIEADCVFSFEVSPMTQVLTGVTFAKRLGIPHYLYVQDLWPENVITVTGISNPIIIKPIEKMVDYIYKNTNHVFATSPSFVNAITNRTVKVDQSKVHYWPQYAEEFYYPREKKNIPEIPEDDSFKIIFTGNIGTAQGLQILPQVASLLKDENVKFVMVGDGRYLNNFNNEVRKHSVVDKFVMIPRQPAERIPELLAASDVAFLSFQDAELWRKTIPAKLQSYMACGMPVIAAAEGETARIIETAQCGICCKIGDAKGLADTIKNMMNRDLIRMSENSRRYFEENFDKNKLMDEMDGFLKTIT